jgi:hypothetical protein
MAAKGRAAFDGVRSWRCWNYTLGFAGSFHAIAFLNVL